MEALYLRSANEVLGLFRPAGAPRVHISDRLPGQVVHVHEMAHRQLCDTTSLGRYMTGLAILGSQQPPREERAIACLAAVLQQCWMVHEGYATYSQMLECRRIGRTDLVDAKKEYLLDSYLSALSQFEIDETGLEEVVRDVAGLRDPQASHATLLLFLGHLTGLAAAASMAIPLCAVLRGRSPEQAAAGFGRVRRMVPGSASGQNITYPTSPSPSPSPSPLNNEPGAAQGKASLTTPWSRQVMRCEVLLMTTRQRPSETCRHSRGFGDRSSRGS
jgi:hypothetical protein